MTDMEEELQKRNTDCIYFLASPLTCKKGIECEYRHSEKARLNTRDCWYWMSGNCLNPTCAFRHPPLDGPSQQPAESAVPKHHGSTAIPTNKPGTPCYFYFNGYCNKFDKCPFLHSLDGSSTAVKPLKPEALPVKNESSKGNETGSVPKVSINSLPANVQRPIMHKTVHTNGEYQKPAFQSIESISPRVSDSEIEEAARVKSVPLLREDGINQSRSNVFTDQSSDDQVDDHVEPEERLESSPSGFDVLVNNKTENSDCEDDLDYLVALDGEHREHFMGYDQDVYDAYDPLDNVHSFDIGRRPLDHERERRSDSVFSRKRRRVSSDELLPTIDVRGGMDLRERLRERRGIDERPTNRLSRQHESSRMNGRIQRRPQRHGVPASQRLHGRLASPVEIELLGDNGISPNGYEHHGWRRGRDLNSFRHHRRERKIDWHSGSHEISRKRSPEGYSPFSGPKSLAQIKEEKKRPGAGFNPVNFEGPKPLIEILKDKGRLSSD